jgi:Leucine-rich repeat (LRR) protein
MNNTLETVICFTTILVGGKHLRELRLSSNGLARINGPLIFTEPPSKLLVDLTNNQIQCISPDVFKISSSRGGKITKLYLGKNRLGGQLYNDVNCSTFQWYKYLTVLDLGANGIKILHPNVFSCLPYLVTLDVGDNALKQIDFEFSHMHQLSSLDLSNNLITTFSSNLMKKLISRFSAQ